MRYPMFQNLFFRNGFIERNETFFYKKISWMKLQETGLDFGTGKYTSFFLNWGKRMQNKWEEEIKRTQKRNMLPYLEPSIVFFMRAGLQSRWNDRERRDHHCHFGCTEKEFAKEKSWNGVINLFQLWPLPLKKIYIPLECIQKCFQNGDIPSGLDFTGFFCVLFIFNNAAMKQNEVA